MLTAPNRKINTSSMSVDDKDILTKPLVTPLVRVIDLQFPLGTVVTARNKFGVTIKDALDAIYKTQKKKVSYVLSEFHVSGVIMIRFAPFHSILHHRLMWHLLVGRR